MRKMATKVRTETPDVVGDIKVTATNVIAFLLYAVVAAVPVAWLFDETIAPRADFFNTVGNNFWGAVLFVLGLNVFLGLFGFRDNTIRRLDLSTNGLYNIVRENLMLWGMFGAGWLIVNNLS